MRETAVAVVGGGRWGRVMVSVLAQMTLPVSKVVMVSRSEAVSLDDALAAYDVRAAIVANSARQHFDTARVLIDQGVNVLIEKPATLSLAQVEQLLERADARRVCLVPGLQYRFCSYIHAAANAVARVPEQPAAFAFEWADPTGEVRYGDRKSYDPTISVAVDVMPHVWSILATVFAQPRFHLESCRIERGGRFASFGCTLNALPGRITLERDAARRNRVLSVESDAGSDLRLDFTVEPGTVSIGTDTVSGDENWDHAPRPLERQVAYFIAALSGTTSNTDAAACRESVALAERAAILLKEQQAAWLRHASRERPFDCDRRYALQELVADDLFDLGLVAPGDRPGFERTIDDAIRIVERRSDVHVPDGLSSALRRWDLM